MSELALQVGSTVLAFTAGRASVSTPPPQEDTSADEAAVRLYTEIRARDTQFAEGSSAAPVSTIVAALLGTSLGSPPEDSLQVFTLTQQLGVLTADLAMAQQTIVELEAERDLALAEAAEAAIANGREGFVINPAALLVPGTDAGLVFSANLAKVGELAAFSTRALGKAPIGAELNVSAYAMVAGELSADPIIPGQSIKLAFRPTPAWTTADATSGLFPLYQSGMTIPIAYIGYGREVYIARNEVAAVPPYLPYPLGVLLQFDELSDLTGLTVGLAEAYTSTNIAYEQPTWNNELGVMEYAVVGSAIPPGYATTVYHWKDCAAPAVVQLRKNLLWVRVPHGGVRLSLAVPTTRTLKVVGATLCTSPSTAYSAPLGISALV